MPIFETLKADHESLRSMYDKVMAEKERGVAFETFNRQLDLHMEAEEQFLYPNTKAAGLTEITLESIEEHHIAKIIEHELERMSGQEETWHPKLRVLIENIEHHIQEEEEKLFPEARDRITLRNQEEMDHLYQDFKSVADIL